MSDFEFSFDADMEHLSLDDLYKVTAAEVAERVNKKLRGYLIEAEAIRNMPGDTPSTSARFDLRPSEVDGYPDSARARIAEMTLADIRGRYYQEEIEQGVVMGPNGVCTKTVWAGKMGVRPFFFLEIADYPNYVAAASTDERFHEILFSQSVNQEPEQASRWRRVAHKLLDEIGKLYHKE